MHDPMVVAFEIRRPWPDWRRARLAKVRWKWRRWSPFITAWGREFYFPALITVWHVEPGGHDAFEVCKRRGHWRWHVHHWKVQVRLLQKIKRFIFERCEECGRRYPWGYAPVSHQWDSPAAPWFKITKRAYHHECSSLVSLRRTRATDERLIKSLFAAFSASAVT
jgi:hypothetical protein